MNEELKTAEDQLARLVQWFDDAEEASKAARTASEKARDYYDGKQLTATEIQALEKRGQPVTIYNRIRPKIDFLLGLEKQSRSDPKAFPRNPADQEGSEAATDALRFVTQNSNWDEVRSLAWENKQIEGYGGCEVTVSFKGKEPEIQTKHIPWDRTFYDPHSSKRDFSDARYMGYVIWKDYDEAIDRWKDGQAAFDANLQSSTTETLDDKPNTTAWADSTRRRVRVVQMHYRKKGQWYWCTFTKGAKLEGGISPFLDGDGEPENPMVLDSAYVDRQNNRSGAVADMIAPQDEINKRRSKALHLISMRQTLADEGAVDDVAKMKRELAKPDGHVIKNPNTEFQILDSTDMTMAQFNLLQEAKNEIDNQGPNEALTGQIGSESGRAIQAKQQGGMIGGNNLADGHRQWSLRVYKQIWNRVRQYWNEEKWVRITDNENNVRFVGMNTPITAGDQYVEQLQQQGASEEEVQAIMQQMGDDPRMQEVVGTKNNTTELEVDLIMEDAPDTITIMQEQFDSLVRLYEAGMPVPPDVLIEASALPSAKKKAILERMQGDPAQAEAGQKNSQLDLAQKEADVENTSMDTNLKEASAMEKVAKANEVSTLN
tara:strand:+ start:2258 stop:4060 length:1803 start_codon:yes stop_codon:yes gene_type:complete